MSTGVKSLQAIADIRVSVGCVLDMLSLKLSTGSAAIALIFAVLPNAHADAFATLVTFQQAPNATATTLHSASPWQVGNGVVASSAHNLSPTSPMQSGAEIASSYDATWHSGAASDHERNFGMVDVELGVELGTDATDNLDAGMLAAVNLRTNLKLGAGYKFADFSNVLTDLPCRSSNLFVNFVRTF